MISKRRGLTVCYVIISLMIYISGFIFVKKTIGMDMGTKHFLILASFIPMLVVIFSLRTCDIFLEDDYLILESDIKTKKFLIKELKINGIQVYANPTFTLSVNNQSFSVTYTAENFNVLKLLINKCKSSNVTEQDLRKIENKLFHPF